MAMLLSAVVVFYGATASAQTPDVGTVSGTVTDQDSAELLTQAVVKAYLAGGPHWPVAVAWTDELGEYELSMPYGEYHIQAHKQNYFPEWWQEAEYCEDAAIVTVIEGTNPTDINFTLTGMSSDPGSIAGVATDFDSGDPIEDAVVRLHLGGNHHLNLVTQTLEDGSYLFEDLPPGIYHLECLKEGYLPSVYPNPVVVNGDEITGIDFALQVLVFGSISGTITNTDGEPVEGARILARLPGHQGFHRLAISSEDGTYLLDELIPGAYRLTCFKQGYLFAEYPDSVVVDGNDVAGIDFVLEPLVFGGITGVVTDGATSEPIEGAIVFAISVDFPHHHRWAITNENGEYVIELLAGVYHVEARAMGYVPDMLDDPVTVGDEIVPDINFALLPVDFGSISGTVYNNVDEVIPGAFIDAHKVGGHWHVHTRSDSLGNYTLENVFPGEYRVKAFAHDYRPHVYEDNVDVENGEAVTGIDFYLEPFEFPHDGVISGIIVDEETSEPVANAMLIAVGRTPNNRVVVRFAHANDDGAYALQHLPEIPFKILCLASDYMPEFYDNKVNWHEADPVTPDAENIDFSLVPAGNGPRMLSGQVIENGIPVAGAIVMAKQNDEIVSFTATYPDGSYYIENLTPGDYTIEVLSPSMSEGSIENISALFTDVYEADIILSPTSVDDNDASLPASTTLLQNYPNPFNASTNISFYLENAGEVNLSVYDLLGRNVTTLTSSRLEAGSHIITWNGTDSDNNSVVSGMYLYILKTADKTYSKRMLLLK